MTGILVPETQKPHEDRRACTVATLLQLLSLLASNVNRGNKLRWRGEEDVIRIYMYRLSQSALGTSLTSIKVSLQCDYSQSLADYKFIVNGIAANLSGTTELI